MAYKDDLSPEWIRDCVMYDKATNALIIAPHYCIKHDVTTLKIAHNKFGSRTIMKLRLDYNHPKYDPKGHYKEQR